MTAKKSVKSTKTKEVKKDKSATHKKEIKKLKEEHKLLKDQYLRVLAEFDNYRKRRNKDFISLRDNANIAFIEELLPIIDDFERSFEAAEKKKSFKSFFEGTNLIYLKFKAILEKQDVESIEAKQKKFDPQFHEAIMQVENEEFPPDTVLEEVLKGYKIKDKVIRYSKVVVSK